MAPEPGDIIWENLQYSRAQQRVRLFLSSCLILMLTILNTILITGGGVYQTLTLEAWNVGGPDAPSFL